MRTARSSSRLWGGVSASVHAGIHTPPPGLGLDTPLGLGLGPPTTPSAQAPNHTPGYGPAHPPARPPPTSPLGLGLGIPPTPVDRMTDTRKNITFANFVRGW